jgi:hypothetical protein
MQGPTSQHRLGGCVFRPKRLRASPQAHPPALTRKAKGSSPKDNPALARRDEVQSTKDKASRQMGEARMATGEKRTVKGELRLP